MDQAQVLMDLWRMFRRRFLLIAVVIGLGSMAATFFAYILPPVYQSEAKILVESQQIPDNLARSTVTASASERLQLIQQRLMTRDNLQRVIDDLGLFANRSDLTVTEKVGLLRQATLIRPIALSGRARFRTDAQLSAFIIRVTYGSPNKAARIANEFVTTVLDQNLRARSERASETLDFFNKEEQRLSQALTALELEITEYKNENEDALPDSLDFRRSEIARLTEQDFEIDQRILELEERRAGLSAQREQAAFRPPPVTSPEEQQLRQLEAELAEKRTIYAENHRVIRAIKARIAAVEALLPATDASSDSDDTTAAFEARTAALSLQIAQLDNQIVLLRDHKDAVGDRRAGIEATIVRTPNIEIQLNALYRRHSELQEQYAVITRKRTEAETGERLEVNQQAERFEVIENAIPPDRPISPNRQKLVVMGGGASIALAIGLAFLLDMMQPAIRTAAQLQRQLELRPVVTIPYVKTRADRMRQLFRFCFWVLLLGVGIPATLYMIDQHYMPLELMGTKIAEKSGIDEIIRMIEARF